MDCGGTVENRILKGHLCSSLPVRGEKKAFISETLIFSIVCTPVVPSTSLGALIYFELGMQLITETGSICVKLSICVSVCIFRALVETTVKCRVVCYAHWLRGKCPWSQQALCWLRRRGIWPIQPAAPAAALHVQVEIQHWCTRLHVREGGLISNLLWLWGKNSETSLQNGTKYSIYSAQ